MTTMVVRERDGEAVMVAEEASPPAWGASASPLAFKKSSLTSASSGSIASTSASSDFDNEQEWAELSRGPARLVPSEVPQVEVEEASDVFVNCFGRIIDKMVSCAASPCGREPTAFDAPRVPVIGICDYIARLSKYSACSTECFVIALVYIDRVTKCENGVAMCQLNVHRLACAAWLLAVKFHDDDYYTNARYAKAAGVAVSELNRLEREFIRAIAWRLHVLPDEYALYHGLMADAVRPGAAVSPGTW